MGNFYGFKLSWNVWSVNPCLTDKNTCHAKAACIETENEDGFRCKCRDGFLGDGKDCRAKTKMNSENVFKNGLSGCPHFTTLKNGVIKLDIL